MNGKAFKKFDLTGKTAFVTGGGAGLGCNITRALSGSGAKVMIGARRMEVLEQAAKQISAETGGEILCCPLDLADKKSVDDCARQVNETLGGVDIFVANAAIEAHERIENNTNETNERMFQVNVISNMALISAFTPHMKEQKWGRIIFCSSMISKVSSYLEGFGAYSATKGAVNAYIRDAAAELGHDGITVNGIIIGVFMTEMVRQVLEAGGEAEATVQDLIDMHALGRLGEPEDIEGIVQLLASNAGSYMTGGEYGLEGGATIMMRPHRKSG